MFTSGTAGQPKAVGVTHANVAAYLRSVTAWCRGGPQARFSQCFDLAFDLSVHDLFVCWSSAACSYVLQENEKFAPTAFIQRHAITHWFSVPSLIAIMRRLGSLKPNSFPSIRQTLFCGEPLVESLARSWDEAAPNSKIHNLYGPTEGTIAITRHRWRRDTRRAAQAIVPIGLPFEGQQALVLDHDRRVVYGSGMGELALAGDQVTEGYIGNDALTQIRFVNVKDDNDNAKRVYLTGDRVRMREELEFIGRIDDQIQLNGYRVEIAEVEEAIRNASRSDAVAVISLPEGTMSATKMVAFVENDDLDLAKIRENCKLNLAAPLIPTAIHAVEQLPYSTNGKINRNALYRIREWK